ncbi:unnamed protein product [Allacma fusca]|uniref:Major facilitator superfamily (MFS) profile domain-containing protein n=1 Tax=Allacma fusca TaxID=39272 RepID=A0A8J2NXU4_9HEXA|nr:unnamed protein product [Allacma fusca]
MGPVPFVMKVEVVRSWLYVPEKSSPLVIANAFKSLYRCGSQSTFSIKLNFKKERWSSPAIPALEGDKNWGNLIEICDDNNGTVKETCKFDGTWGPSQWIGSLVALGALISGPVTGFCVERFGRKTTMLLLSAPFVLGWLLITYAESVAMIYAGRLVTGFCGGAFSLAAPVYIGETSEDSVRGTLGAGFQLMVTVGILFVYVVGDAVSWEWLSLISGFGPLVFLVLMIFPPESPRWLISVGKHTEASESLRWLRGASSSQDVEEELAVIQKSVNESKQQSATFKDLLAPAILKPTLIALALMLFQQLSGVNAVIFYTTEIFLDAGSDLEPALCTIIVGIVQVVATVLSSILMDRAGRKLLLLVSDAAMCLFLVLLGVFFYFKDNDTETAEKIGWLPLVSLIFFIVFFSLGYGPIPWLMMGELLPPHVKGLASAIATSFNWILAFIVTMFFKDLKNGIGAAWCYWLFAIVCAAGTVFVFIFVPETKGKSLDEIQRYFGAPESTPNPQSSNSEKTEEPEP